MKIEDLLEQSEAFETHKTDHPGPSSQFSFHEETAQMITPPSLMGSVLLEQTPWAFTQMCNKLGKAVYGKGSGKSLPAEYLAAMRPDLRAYVLNDHIRESEGSWLVRAYDNYARAVLSDRYATIGNHELLVAVDQIIKQKSGSLPSVTLFRSSVTHDEMHLKILWKNVDTDDGPFGLGCYVGNSEIGSRRVTVQPLIQRHSCTNSIIVNTDMGGFETTHIGSRQAKVTLIMAKMVEALQGSADLLDQFLQSYQDEIPNFDEVLGGLAAKYDWDEALTVAVAFGTEGSGTRAGLVNGVSYAAHALEGLSDDERVSLEVIAGSLLGVPVHGEV